MVKVKNARLPGPLYNPFNNINQHGVALLDPDRVWQICLQSGKSVGESHLNVMNLSFVDSSCSDVL